MMTYLNKSHPLLKAIRNSATLRKDSKRIIHKHGDDEVENSRMSFRVRLFTEGEEEKLWVNIDYSVVIRGLPYITLQCLCTV